MFNWKENKNMMICLSNYLTAESLCLSQAWRELLFILGRSCFLPSLASLSLPSQLTLEWWPNNKQGRQKKEKDTNWLFLKENKIVNNCKKLLLTFLPPSLSFSALGTYFGNRRLQNPGIAKIQGKIINFWGEMTTYGNWFSLFGVNLKGTLCTQHTSERYQKHFWTYSVHV